MVLGYYATFDAGQAALWRRGRTAKSHRSLIAHFSQEFLAPGPVEEGYYAIQWKGREHRPKASYDHIHFEIAVEQPDGIVDDARRFLARKRQAISHS